MSADPRLLLLTDKFAPHAGGTAAVYREWCDRLPPEAVHVITCRYPGGERFDATRAYQIDRVPFLDLPKVRMPLVWAGIRHRALAVGRESAPQVVHAGQILETGLTALALKRRLGIPYVVHTYGEEIQYWARWSATRARMRDVLQEAAAVTAVSGYTSRRMAELGLWSGPVTLLYPGTDASRFTGEGGAALRQRLDLGDGPLLVTVARLLTRKGHDRVIEALPAIREAVPGTRYLVAGAGRGAGRLRALAARRGLSEAVVFTGQIAHDELPACFAAADVFIHPNRELATGDVEGFGIVFLEASASGVPVIGGNSGGTPDAIRDGETGFLVDPGSVEEIAARTIQLLRDPELRRRMGAAGRAWAAGFTWDRAARQVRELSARVAG